jgi:hypothetical protein
MSENRIKPGKMIRKKSSASGIIAAALGVYGGFFGMGHGVGEIIQGNTLIKNIRIYALGAPGLPFPFGREPAMTLLPTYLSAGVLTVLIGSAIMVWPFVFLTKKYGSIVLLLLSILLLLAGGGYATVAMLFAACIAGAKACSEFKWLKKNLPSRFRRLAGKTWKIFILLSILWVPFEFILGWLFRVGYPDPGYLLAYAMPVWMTLAVLTGILNDSAAPDVGDKDKDRRNP